MNVTKVKNNYTIKETDPMVVCDSGSALTLTIKSTSGTGDVYYIKNIGVGIVTLSAISPDLIEGVSTKLLVQYASCILFDYDVNVWLVI